MDNTFKYIAIIINISILVCAIFVEFKSVLDVVLLLITIFMVNLLCYLAHGIINGHK